MKIKENGRNNSTDPAAKIYSRALARINFAHLQRARLTFLSRGLPTYGTPFIRRSVCIAGLSSGVISASDCGVRGPRFESRR